ncbi:MAG: YhjD/YihY/BrkB family envelope integrity protein [Trueperaceae bacterium]
MSDAASRPRSWRRRLPPALLHAERFARHLVRRFVRTQVSMLAAALAYYAAFSLGPLVLLLGGWLGNALRARPELSERFREALAELLTPVLPEGFDGGELIESAFTGVVDQLASGGWFGLALTLLVLLWAASGFFASLQRALEVIFDVPSTRGFLRTRLVALVLIGAVAAVIIVELIGVTVFGWAWGVAEAGVTQLEGLGFDLPDLGSRPTELGPARLLLALAAFTLCFRYLPRGGSRWDGALIGAAVSIAGLQAMRLILPLAFDEARFNLVYGVVASLVVLLLWLYLALLLFLVGALVAAEASAEGRRRARRNQRRASHAADGHDHPGDHHASPTSEPERDGAHERG